MLGQADFSGTQPNRGGEVTAASLNWCYSVAIIGTSLVVCDTGNRRVLVWHEIPLRNATPADLVLGQSGMDCRDENAGMGMNAYGMRWPHAACRFGEHLVVAALLTGQPDFQSKGDNRWKLPVRDSLCWPYGLSACADVRVVSDSGNNRVLLWRAAS